MPYWQLPLPSDVKVDIPVGHGSKKFDQSDGCIKRCMSLLLLFCPLTCFEKKLSKTCSSSSSKFFFLLAHIVGMLSAEFSLK